MVTRLDTRQMHHSAYAIDRSGSEWKPDCILVTRLDTWHADVVLGLGKLLMYRSMCFNCSVVLYLS